MLRRLLVLVALVVAALAVAAPSADAHSGKTSYLYVSLYDDGVEARVEMPAADVARVLGIEIPRDKAGAEDAIDANAELIAEYIADNTGLGDDDGPWQLTVADEGRILATESGLYVLFDVEVDEEFDAAPSTFIADFSVIIESDPERDALLLIENDWSSARFANEGDHLLGFSVGMTQQVAVIESVPVLDAVGEVRGLGTDAVRTGIDLLLIVVGLTLLSVMGRGQTLRTAPAAEVARRSGRHLVVFIATLSISLWASGLGLLAPSARFTGIVVALTLAATGVVAGIARFRAMDERTTTAIVAAVGLVHGFGLGRTFIDFGLDRRREVLGLLAFEVGVLAAVVIVVACVVGPMLLLRSRSLGDLLAVGLAAILVAYAMAWLGERVLDTEWPIERVANPLRVWPRNLWFVAAAVAVAAIIGRLGRSPDSALEETSAP